MKIVRFHTAYRHFNHKHCAVYKYTLLRNLRNALNNILRLIVVFCIFLKSGKLRSILNMGKGPRFVSKRFQQLKIIFCYFIAQFCMSFSSKYIKGYFGANDFIKCKSPF